MSRLVSALGVDPRLVAATAIAAITYLVLVALAPSPLLNVWLVAAIAIAALSPTSAILLAVVTLVPPDFGLVRNLPTALFVLVGGAIGALARASIDGRRLAVTWPAVAAIAFGLITLLNLLWVVGRDVEAPRAVPDWTVLLSGLIACLLVAGDASAARAGPTIVFGAGVVISVIASFAVWLPAIFDSSPLAWLVRQGIVGRAAGSTHGANVLGIIAAMAFAYFFIGAMGRVKGRDRAIGLLVAASCIPALYLTFSRSAALGLGVAVVLGLYLLGRRAAILVGVAIVAAALVVGPTLFQSRLDTSSGRPGGNRDPAVIEAQANSDRLRVAAWAAGVRMAIDRPLTGVGFGRYPALREDYGGPPELNTPHSDYIRFFAETGVPGGLAFLVFIAGVIWSIAGGRGVVRASLAASLTAFCIATQFNAQLYYLESSLPFWVAAGAAIRLRAPPLVTDPADSPPRDGVRPDPPRPMRQARPSPPDASPQPD